MSQKNNLVVWGASGHAIVVTDIIKQVNVYKIFGYLDNINCSAKGKVFLDSRIIGGGEMIPELLNKKIMKAVVAIGDCKARLKISKLLLTKGFSLYSAIHPRSIVSPSAVIGEGSVVCAGSVINPKTKIGMSVIVNTGSSVDHECVLHDGVHVAPGCHLGGGVTVGEGSWIGIGACIKDHVKIGKNSIVGAGSVVLEDIPDNVVAYGAPAKRIRKN